MNKVAINGDVFGELTVLRDVEKSGRHRRVECLCNCGNKKIVLVSNIRGGKTRSCGCVQIESTRNSNSTHKMSSTQVYVTWNNMKSRCNNTKNKDYPNYGGRGITVCERWSDSFEEFYKDMGDRPKGMTIDRIDNSKGYFKENCRWASPKTQARNKRNNIIVKFNGSNKTLIEHCDDIGLKYKTVFKRIRQSKYSIDLALKKSI